MPIAVSGFLSRDGNFFTSECEARVHDAEMEIIEYCSRNQLVSEKVLYIIEALADPIMEFVNASQELRDEKEQALEAGKADNREQDFTGLDLDTTDDSEAGRDTLSVLEQPIDRHEPMSDLGSSPQPEDVLDSRPRPRSRSRRRDA